MAIEKETNKNNSPAHKEFENLLNQDFKDRKLKEDEIIKATITEITKNFIVVDCKAKMEGMIPVEEFTDITLVSDDHDEHGDHGGHDHNDDHCEYGKNESEAGKVKMEKIKVKLEKRKQKQEM